MGLYRPKNTFCDFDRMRAFTPAKARLLHDACDKRDPKDLARHMDALGSKSYSAAWDVWPLGLASVVCSRQPVRVEFIVGKHRLRCRALAAVALSVQTGTGPPPHSQIRGHRSQVLAQERAWPEVGAGATGSGARVGADGLAPLPDICARHRARNWGHVCPSIFPAALADSHWSPHPLTTLRASAAVEQDSTTPNTIAAPVAKHVVLLRA